MKIELYSWVRRTPLMDMGQMVFPFKAIPQVLLLCIGVLCFEGVGLGQLGSPIMELPGSTEPGRLQKR